MRRFFAEVDVWLFSSQMLIASCRTPADVELLDAIEKDVVRTHPQHGFFSKRVQIALSSILFVYAKMNLGVGYVQVSLNLWLTVL